VLTLSEVFQEKLGIKECPFILSCDVEVVKGFFGQVCKTPNYTNCNYFARRMGELRVPLVWLQRYAVSHTGNEIEIGPEEKMGEQTTVKREI
jgi:hypothetical protein